MRQLEEALGERLEDVVGGNPTILTTTGTRAAIEALLVRTERLEAQVASLISAQQARGRDHGEVESPSF
jgi:hypothetical protein